ncbi:MAG: hypothetical protein ACP5PC_09575 [bacterium]
MGIMKKIEIIGIAKRKIEQRDISESWAKETISFPMQIVSGYGNRKVAQRMYLINEK